MTTTTRRLPRMPGEIECDEQIPGSYLYIAGGFDWSPSVTVGDEQIPTGKTFSIVRLRSGLCLHTNTATKVMETLDLYAQSQTTRLSLHYGDTETGKDWLDEWGMEGYIGRSMGPFVVPLMIANARSDFGGPILDDCIVRIRFANRSVGGDLYRHPTYHADRDEHRRNIPDPVVEERVWNRRFA